MTGEEFYQEFKASLYHLGFAFHEMDKVEVTSFMNCLCMSGNGKTTMLALPIGVPTKPKGEDHDK